MYAVYKFTYADGRAYIGVTNDTNRRFNEHRLAKSNCVFDNAIRELGFNTFSYEELYHTVTWTEAVKLECECISRYSTMFPVGFNMNNGGAGASSERKYGENHHGAKLTEREAISIIHDPRPASAVANDYNIAKQTINSLRSGKSWKNLDRSDAPVYQKDQALSQQQRNIILSTDTPHCQLAKIWNIGADTIRMYRKRHHKISKDAKYKLTNEDILTIHSSNETNTELAITFGVDQSHISKIRNGQRRTQRG